MTALLSTIARPMVAWTPAAPSRLLRACCDSVARYFARRDALARLREFSDTELADIGLTRSQIEPAIHGRPVSLPEWPRR